MTYNYFCLVWYLASPASKSSFVCQNVIVLMEVNQCIITFSLLVHYCFLLSVFRCYSCMHFCPVMCFCLYKEDKGVGGGRGGGGEGRGDFIYEKEMLKEDRNRNV